MPSLNGDAMYIHLQIPVFSWKQHMSILYPAHCLGCFGKGIVKSFSMTSLWWYTIFPIWNQTFPQQINCGIRSAITALSIFELTPFTKHIDLNGHSFTSTCVFTVQTRLPNNKYPLQLRMRILAIAGGPLTTDLQCIYFMHSPQIFHVVKLLRLQLNAKISQHHMAWCTTDVEMFSSDMQQEGSQILESIVTAVLKFIVIT